MYVLRVWPGGADVAVTAEECALLARVCQQVEMGSNVEGALVALVGALFRALAEAALARVCMRSKGRQDLEELMDELVY